jgi:hypothetical protein
MKYVPCSAYVKDKKNGTARDREARQLRREFNEKSSFNQAA